MRHFAAGFVIAALALPAVSLAGPNEKPAPEAPSSKPAPEAPSTGKELTTVKRPPPAEVAAGVARQIIAKGDCTGRVPDLSTALTLGVSALTDDERIKGHVMLQHCAKHAKAWLALLQGQSYLLTHAPDKFEADDFIEAFMQLGDSAHALSSIKLIAKNMPKQGANLTIAASMIVCHMNDYAACFTTSAKMLDLLKKAKPAPSNLAEAMFKNTVFHATSAIALGHYDAFAADVKQLDAATTSATAASTKVIVGRLEAAADQAHTAKLYVEIEQPAELPLGTYHLMTRKNANIGEAGALLTLRFVNQDKVQRTVKIAVDVPSVTESITETVTLPPGKQVTKSYTPPIKIDFDVVKLRAPRASQLALHVTDAKSGTSVFDRSFAIQVLPRDYLPMRRLIGSDGVRTTLPNAAAWITPNTPEIDAFLKQAKERITEGRFKKSFTGEQHATLPQVKALFDELKSRGVSYVSDPKIFDERGSTQRTRLPAEVLASTNAQCLEGTLLYASLFEAIGLHPFLIFINGHAFVAWHPAAEDNTKAQLLFLETTMTGGAATFEQAVDSATATYAEQVATKQFDLGIAHVINVAALRAQGYTPQPY